jgi:deoxycytidylate deaminase
LLEQRNLRNPTVEQLQDLGNELRAEYGNSYLIKRLLENIKVEGNYRGIIVDSIRNDGEVHTLKQFPYFYLFSIQADQSIRCDRTIKIGKFKNKEEFYKADERDQAEDIPYGQQVKKCNYLADIIIINDKDIHKDAVKDKNQFINDIYNRFILLIELKKEGKPTPQHIPSIDETLMTMAYVESRRSSCLKRKVGAIIASIDVIPQESFFDKSICESVHVVSSGYNEVPFGAVPCIFTEYGKCYRDYLLEEHAKKINYCPTCGKKVELPLIKCKCGYETANYLRVCPQCKRELEIEYFCPDCDTEVFKEYLQTDGKLLDMCRALHAEENAILNLIKTGGKNFHNLVLYTTTYPCNLCANKIVAAGIKKVIYADPYPMREAKDILEKGGVKTEKFQGIKSLAFFRLFYIM